MADADPRLRRDRSRFQIQRHCRARVAEGRAFVDKVIVACTGGSDCGPDSGKSDNERVVLWLDPSDEPVAGHWQSFQIDGDFDTIIIKPVSSSSKYKSAAISLEGGFNGAAPGPAGRQPRWHYRHPVQGGRVLRRRDRLCWHQPSLWRGRLPPPRSPVATTPTAGARDRWMGCSSTSSPGWRAAASSSTSSPIPSTARRRPVPRGDHLDLPRPTGDSRPVLHPQSTTTMSAPGSESCRGV